MHVSVVIPALNEEQTIGAVVAGLKQTLVRLGHRAEVVVGDNGSTDDTRAAAEAAGAKVVSAPRQGYGTACLAAMTALDPACEVVVFADGDGADDPGDLGALLEPLVHDEADLVLGSRALGETLGLVESGALSRPQRFGNRLASTLLMTIFGFHYTDLGPFRAVRKEALDALAMDDPDFGWTVQMQARAAKRKLRVQEVPVHYRRRRAGESKVSGDVKGSFLAGTIILTTLAEEVVPSRVRPLLRRPVERLRARLLGPREAANALSRRG